MPRRNHRPPRREPQPVARPEPPAASTHHETEELARALVRTGRAPVSVLEDALPQNRKPRRDAK